MYIPQWILLSTCIERFYNFLKKFKGSQHGYICKILSKSNQKRDFSHYTENISVQSSCKFIIELEKCNTDLFHDV